MMLRALLCVAALAALSGCDGLDAEARADKIACENGELEPETQVEHCTRFLENERLRDDMRAHALHQRAWARQSLGDSEAALADYDASIALDSTDASVFFNRGRLRIERGMTDEALEDFAAAARNNASWADPLTWRANLLVERGDYAGAIEAVNGAVRAAPYDAGLYNQRCWIRAQLVRALDKALADCNHSLELRPDDSNTLDSRGLVYLHLGRYADAFADYDAALAADENYAHALYGRGVAALGLGRAEEGQADVAKAAAMQPNIADFYAGYGVVLTDVIASAPAASPATSAEETTPVKPAAPSPAPQPPRTSPL
jgi:tetratricopeptide (TPR) repeat protein